MINAIVVTGIKATQSDVCSVVKSDRIPNNRPVWNMLMDRHRSEGISVGSMDNANRTRIWDAGLIQCTLRDLGLYKPTSVNDYLLSINVKPNRSLSAKITHRARAICIKNGLFIEKDKANIYPMGMIAAIYESL